MRRNADIGVVQVGLEGPVADAFRDIVGEQNSPFKLEAVAASRGEHLGKTLGSVLESAPYTLADVPIISVDDAIHNTESSVVFSALRPIAASHYEDDLANGRMLATNAGANRMRDDVPLANAYINPAHIDEAYSTRDSGVIVANGNCTSILMTTALAPIHAALGIETIGANTLQGWSGAGLTEVPEGQEGKISPIEGDEADKIQTEPRKFLGETIAKHADIAISAQPRRAPWVRGHFGRVFITTQSPSSQGDIEELWAQHTMPEALDRYRHLYWMPSDSPIDVVEKRTPANNEMLIKVGDKMRLQPQHPMSVMARISMELEGQNATFFDFSGDNLVLGAAGASAMNILYANEMGYIK